MTTIERQAASRYWPQRRELPGEQGMLGGWWWLIVDTTTGDYVPGWKCETREEAMRLCVLAETYEPAMEALAVALEVLA